MKNSFKKLVILLSIVFSTSIYAVPFSSFKGNKKYSLEGRFLIANKKYFFRINEGNANEENISLEANPNKLEKDRKYKICLKIKNDCHLNCTGETLQLIKEIKPWEESAAMITQSDGAYNEASNGQCNK